jgi:hypothetical protein
VLDGLSALLLTSNGWLKGNDGLRIKNRVETAPGMVADHLPIVAGSARVLGEQDVARAKRKSPIRRFEFHVAAEGNDQLSIGIRVSSELRIRIRFME